MKRVLLVFILLGCRTSSPIEPALVLCSIQDSTTQLAFNLQPCNPIVVKQ